MGRGRRRKIEPRPSFFKVLTTNDFTRCLRIPRVFMREFGKKFGENVKLRINSATRKIWNVKIQQRGDGKEDYCITGKDWTKFTQEMGLKISEFLVFWFMGRSTFRVSVYGSTGCERENPLGLGYNRSKTLVEEEEEHEPAINDDKASMSMSLGNSNNPSFEVILKEYQKSRLFLPKMFVEASGLIEKKKASLVYPGGRRVDDVVVVKRDGRCRNGRANIRFELCRGWSEFIKSNGLVLGKAYLFEFTSSENVISIRPVKKRKK